MKRANTLWAAIIAVCLVLPSTLVAQRLVTPEPEAVFPEPFSNIAGVREMPDGRVMIADRLEQHVSIIDFRNGSIEQVGREGQGPGEYSTPMGLFRLPDGATLLADMGNMRLSIIDADLSIGESYPMMRQDQGMLFVRPRGTDRNGMAYFSMQGMIMAVGGGPAARPDSGAVIRLDLLTDEMDTVAMLALPAPRSGSGGTRMRIQGGGSVNIASMMPAPFAPRDAWAVGPDGSVVVARANQYRVDRYLPNGTTIQGPVTNFSPIRVSQAVKDRWADARGSMQVSFQTPGGGGRAMRMERPETDGVEFPEYLPPFDAGDVAVALDGRAWVKMNTKPGDPTRYDVFSAEGAKVMEVRLPARTSIVGYGDGVIYAVSVDEDDLQWFGRYRIPLNTTPSLYRS